MRKSHKKKKKKVSSSSAECFSECNLPVLKIWNAWGMCRQMGYDLCILLSCTRYDFGETYFYVPSFFHPIEITHRRKATKLFYFLFFLSIFLCFFVVWKITFEFTWPSTPAVKMRTEDFRGRGGHGAFTGNIVLGCKSPSTPSPQHPIWLLCKIWETTVHLIRDESTMSDTSWYILLWLIVQKTEINST